MLRVWYSLRAAGAEEGAPGGWTRFEGSLLRAKAFVLVVAVLLVDCWIYGCLVGHGCAVWAEIAVKFLHFFTPHHSARVTHTHTCNHLHNSIRGIVLRLSSHLVVVHIDTTHIPDALLPRG